MSDRYQSLREMSTDKLEKLLQEDAQRSDNRQMDTEQIFCILQILEERGAGEGVDAQKAYGSFRRNYMPKDREIWQAEQPKRSRIGKQLWVAVAAAAAAVVLTVGVLWPTLSGGGNMHKLHVESLSANSISIRDGSGKQTAVAEVEFDQFSICATIAPDADAAENYDYTAVITYTYYPMGATGTDSLRTASFVLSTEGNGKTGEQIAFFPGKISGICSASATFRAVEKKENGKIVLQDEVVEFPRMGSEA